MKRKLLAVSGGPMEASLDLKQEAGAADAK